MKLNLVPLEFALTLTEVILTSRPTYKLRLSYGILTTVLRTSVCPLDTRAGINLIRSKMIPHDRETLMKRNNLPSLCTTPRQPLSLDGLVLLHLQLSDLQTRVWFRIVPYLVVSILIATSFIDRIVKGRVPSEEKIVPGIRNQ